MLKEKRPGGISLKKFIAGLILGVGLTATTAVFADELKQIAATVRADFNVSLNGQTIALSKQPVIVDGSMYLPLKDVAEATGLNVKWNEATLTAELSKPAETAPPAEKPVEQVKIEKLNGYLQNSSSPAIRYNGLIYLPLRDGGEKYNLRLSYDDKAKTISIDNTGRTVPLSIEAPTGDNMDSFIFEGTSYIKESIFADAGQLVATRISNECPHIKTMFKAGNRSLTDNNVVVTRADYTGDLSEDAFFEEWQSFNEARECLKIYSKEIQSINPDYPLSIDFYFKEIRIASTSVSLGNLPPSVSIVPNPLKNQNTIK